MKQVTWKSLITAALGIAFLFSVVSFQSAAAQEYNILYRFRGGIDGYQPEAGLTLDAAGRLYGTEPFGGAHLHGSVFRLRHTHTRWVHDILYSFAGRSDGEGPIARVIFGPDGNLYGTTSGGGGIGCGTVFKLTIPTTARQFFFGNWKETVVYGFTNSPDGCNPSLGALVFDHNRVLYGTTEGGGLHCEPTGSCGTVFAISGGQESIIYRFTGGADGQRPFSGLIVDDAGNLYGTTSHGGAFGFGTVYELSHSDSGWTQRVLYNFTDGDDGAEPAGGLTFDANGNLFGTTFYGGSGGGGTAFMLTTNGSLNVICSFVGEAGPADSLVMDRNGNFYGTTYYDGADGYGSVFRLTRQQNDTWTCDDLHDFWLDGVYLSGGPVLDPQGNLYGTTETGQRDNGVNGLIYEITP